MKTLALVAVLFAGATMAVPVETKSQPIICWAACFPEKPNCAETMIATRFGACWTCCAK